MGYRERLPGYFPSYFGPRLHTLGQAMGAELDARAEQVLRGRLAGIPFAGGANPGRVGGARLADGRLIECEEYALEVHAADRGLTLYSTEGALSKRIRLSQWHQLHQQRGTPWGRIAHVRPYFADFVAAGGAYPTITIVYQDNEGTPAAIWYRVDPAGGRTIRRVSPSNWNWDGLAERRSRLWAIIHLPTGYITNGFLWDAGPAWDSGPLWDGLPAGVFADLWSMIDEWGAAHSLLSGLIVTDLQPGADIPGWPGVHPFDPASVYQIDANGTSTLPLGNWGTPVYTTGAFVGNNTRPTWATFYRINNG